MTDFIEGEAIVPGHVTAKDSFTLPADADVSALAAALGGAVVSPGDADYDRARAVWNGRIDRRPALVVQAACAEDAAVAVRFAAEQGLPLAVRGAGHHPAGFGTIDDGLVLDLSGMKGIDIDVEARTARVEPGVTSGEFMGAIFAKGLICTVGSHPTVGLTGLTLGGGMGVLMGRYGLTSDNLLAAEVVTADGRQVRADENENADLFWALRGGGGCFGVVTSMTIRLYPAETTLAGMLIHPVERTSDALTFFRDFTRTTPDALGTLAAVLTTPDGNRVCVLMACHSGAAEEGEKALAPLRAFGPPLVDTIQPIPYPAILGIFEEADPAGGRYAYSTHRLPELSDEAIAAIDGFARGITSPHTALVVYHQHGAVNRLPADATAYGGRNVPYMLGVYTGWMDGEDASHLEWFASVCQGIAPFSNGASYLNLRGDLCEADVCAAYGTNYARLQAIKAKWDPRNLFRCNPNIAPETAAS